jgi:TatD DNase family protein
MIDTHTHLYSEEFSNDLENVMARAAGKGIYKFFLPAIDSSTTEAMLFIESSYPDRCFAMMGLHPCSVNETYETELEHVRGWLAARPFAAVGEIGLDFYWDKTFTEEQYIVFRKQMELALQYGLPVVIHSRNATAETIQVIREYSGRNLRGIFHCFGGTGEEAQQIIDCGFLLGIGGVVTYKNAGLAAVIADIDLSHLVLETDAPYLSPVPYRGKRNESSYLGFIAEKIADSKNIPVEEVIRRTTENAEAMFKLPA